MSGFPPDTDEDPVRTPPQTESATQRGFGDEDAPEDFERSDELDDLDSDSDIADEGPGHRG